MVTSKQKDTNVHPRTRSSLSIEGNWIIQLVSNIVSGEQENLALKGGVSDMEKWIVRVAKFMKGRIFDSLWSPSPAYHAR